MSADRPAPPLPRSVRVDAHEREDGAIRCVVVIGTDTAHETKWRRGTGAGLRALGDAERWIVRHMDEIKGRRNA